MIENQRKEGATYSDLVQQFLHVLLNAKAAKSGQAPNFFIEPETQIVISLNVNKILKQAYGRLEGCTGTAGNKDELAYYQSEYHIDHVIKLPTHLEPQTQYLMPQYCYQTQEHMAVIASAILSYSNQPVLVTCEDDIEVKRIASAVIPQLKMAKTDKTQFIVDTNDSGKNEQDVLPLACLNISVTFSARMGRGTDIRPESEKGLVVLRTYAEIPRIEKQERGRQGRNGKPGICRDLIDYASVVQYIKSIFSDGAMKATFMQLFEKERLHLLEKLEKNKDKSDYKLRFLARESQTQQQYLMTRTLSIFKRDQKNQHDRYTRQKEVILAHYSLTAFEYLNQQSLESSDAFRKDWCQFVRVFDNLWHDFLANQHSGDKSILFLKFETEVNAKWKQLYQRHNVPLLSCEINSSEDDKSYSVSSELLNEKYIAETIFLYQQWVGGVYENYHAAPLSDKLLEAFYKADGLFILFSQMKAVRADKLAIMKDFYEKLSSINTIYCVNCLTYAELIGWLIYDRNQDEIASILSFFNESWFSTAVPKALQPEDIEKNSLLLKFAMQLFVLSSDEKTRRFMINFASIIRESYWERWTPAFYAFLVPVFLSNVDLLMLFVQLNQFDLDKTIELLFLAFKDEARGDQRVRDWISYLEQNLAYLIQHPYLYPMITEMLLNPDNHHYHNQLPKADCMSSYPEDMQIKFWFFLTQRQPLDESVIMKFISQLERFKQNLALIHDVLLLPPYLPIRVIHAQLNKVRQTEDNFVAIMGDLRPSALQFNAFLYNYGLIQSIHQFNVNADKIADFIGWQKRYESVTLEKATQFFSEPWLPSLPLSLPGVATLFDLYANEVITDQCQLSGVFKTLIMMHEVCQLHPELLSVLEKALLFAVENKKIGALNRLLSILNNYRDVVVLHAEWVINLVSSFDNSPHSSAYFDGLHIFIIHLKQFGFANTPLVSALYDRMQELVDRDHVSLIRLAFSVSKKIFSLSDPAVRKEIMNTVLTHIADDSMVDLHRFLSIGRQFFEWPALQQLSINDVAQFVFLSRLFEQPSISSLDDYAQTLLAIHLLVESNSKLISKMKGKEGVRFFDLFHQFVVQHKSPDRKFDFHFFEHGLVTLPQDLTIEQFQASLAELDDCFGMTPGKSESRFEYWATKIKSVVNAALVDVTTQVRKGERADFKPAFIALSTCATELVNVVRKTSLDVSEPSIEQMEVMRRIDVISREYQLIFDSRKSIYASFWQNRKRTEQAQKLFSTDMRPIHQMTACDFYMRILKHISDLQIKMLESDAEGDAGCCSSKINAKGYSCLFNLSLELYLMIARDFLTAAGVSLRDKTHYLENELLDHLVSQIHILNKRIDYEPFNLNVLRTDTKLVNYVPSIEAYRKQHQAVFSDQGTLKHLVYLIDSIEDLAQLTRCFPLPQKIDLLFR